MTPILALDAVSLDFLSRKRAGGGRTGDKLKRAAGAQAKTVVLALDAVSLTVSPGESVAVVGPPECGITTLLRVAAGVLYPDEGHASVPADRIAWFSGARLTDGALSVRQNVDLMVGLYGRPAVEDPEFALRCASWVGVEDRINSPMENLPGGTGLRLGLAVALSLPAPLYVLDGPLDGGTREFRDRVRRRLLELHADGAALLVGTDKAATLLGVADRAVRLDKGRVTEDGPAQDILSRPDAKGPRSRPRPQRRDDDDEDDDAYG